MSAIAELKRAKEHSDKKQYGAKHRIIQQMMRDNPEAFVIDSDDGSGIVGVTHKKTGFRFHLPAGKVIPGVVKEARVGIPQLSELLSKIKDGKTAQSLVSKLPTADDITGLGGKLANKTLRFLEQHPKAEERLRQATSYRLLDPRNRGKNMTAGSLLGGVPGAGLGGLAGGVLGARQCGE